MDYCKITETKQARMMPNPIRVAIANPTETQKATLAPMLGYLPMQYTPEPEYDPETQYVTSYWEEESGKAVQHWEIHDKPTPEPTIEDRVENLEGNVSDIINGVTEE